MMSACSDNALVDREQKIYDMKTMDVLKSDILERQNDSTKETSKFPDPDRLSKKKCKTSLDCKRGEYCFDDPAHMSCTSLKGCGAFGKPPLREEWGCVIEPVGGVGRVTASECGPDNICPKKMPYCYLRACQVNPSCTKDSECTDTQYCDFNAFCVTYRPCKTHRDCSDIGGKCGADNFCERRESL